MKGSNHVIANVSTVGGCFIALQAVQTAYPTWVVPVTDYLSHNWISDLHIPSVPLIVFAINAAVFMVASVLPDIDSPSSVLGRYITFPGPHRGITHSIWPVLVFFIAGMTCRVFMWAAIGYFLHLFYDSFSTAGICWFYPFSNYVRYESGAFVKCGRHLALYRSGDISETMCVIMIVGIFVLLVGLVIFKVIPMELNLSWDHLRVFVTVIKP